MNEDVLSYQPLVERYLQQAPAFLSSLSFVSICVWQDFFQFQFEEIDGNLCIFATDAAGTFLYVPPLGKKMSQLAIDQCFERMKNINRGSAVTRIENVSEEHLVHFSSAQHKVYQRGYETLYYRKDLLQFSGDAYKSKRNAYNHFIKNFSAQYCSYESSMLDECCELYETWARDKRLTLCKDIDFMMLEDNKTVHRWALKLFAQLGLVGRVIQVDGRIVAYTFGYFISPEIFCDFLEVADRKYKGLATYVFKQFCADPVLQAVKFINVMDDFAMETVNWTKMSFRPALLLPIYSVGLDR